MRKAISEVGVFSDEAARSNSLAKLGWLTRMSDTCPCNIPRDARRASFDERPASGPNQLQSCKDRDHGNNGFQLVGGTLRASKQPSTTPGTPPRRSSKSTGVLMEPKLQ